MKLNLNFNQSRYYLLFLLLIVNNAISQNYPKWDNSQSYNEGDIVIYNGIRFISDFTVSAGIIPEDNSDYWSPVFIPKIDEVSDQRLSFRGHENVAHALLLHPAIKQLITDFGLGSKYSKSYKDADKLDFRDFFLTGPQWHHDNYHHSSQKIWQKRQYAMRYNLEDDYASFYRLSRYEHFIYLLHNIGDATVPYGHWGKNQYDLYEMDYENLVKRECRDRDAQQVMEDYINPYEGTIYQCANTFVSEMLELKSKCGSWENHNHDFLRKVAFNSDPGFPRGGVRCGLSHGVNALIDCVLAWLPLKNVQLSGKDIITDGGSEIYTASAIDPDDVIYSNNTVLTNGRGYYFNDGLNPAYPKHIIEYYWDLGGNFDDTYDDKGKCITDDRSQIRITNEDIRAANGRIRVKIVDDEGYTVVLYKYIKLKPELNVETKKNYITDKEELILRSEEVYVDNSLPIYLTSISDETEPFQYIYNNYINGKSVSFSRGFKNHECYSPISFESSYELGSHDPDDEAIPQNLVGIRSKLTYREDNINYVDLGYNLKSQYDVDGGEYTGWSILTDYGNAYVPIYKTGPSSYYYYYMFYIGHPSNETFYQKEANNTSLNELMNHILTPKKLYYSYDVNNDNTFEDFFGFGDKTEYTDYFSLNLNSNNSEVVLNSENNISIKSNNYNHSFWNNKISENNKFKLRAIDNENQFCDKEINLPVLTTPQLVYFTINSTNISVKDNLLDINITTIDEDNNSDTDEGIDSWEWGFKGVNIGGDVSLLSDDWTGFENGKQLSLTYVEMLERLNLLPGESYEIYVKISDDDHLITRIVDGYGVSVYKLGEFILEKPLEGDINLDGTVDKTDYLELMSNINTEITSDKWIDKWRMGDLNLDGIINESDRAAMLKHYKPDISPILNLLLN